MTDSNQFAVQDEQPSTRVVEAVAEAEETDQLNLPPLYDAVDPDALDTLVADDVAVSFEYAGYTIDVRGTTEISVQ